MSSFSELKSSESVHWLYLDMNSFFASCEQQMNPSLRGKPVAVVPLMADTTCCIAASYEAKKFGVKTGTRVGDAKKLCPGIHLIEGEHEHYIRYHHQIIEAVESCLPVDSVCSIDEIACRLTGSQRKPETARAIAFRIKEAIRDRIGAFLKCSIGVAPNRYLAKIAADMRKPDGFTVITPGDLPGALHGLTLRDLPGVGPRMEERFRKQGITSMKTLASLSEAQMRASWGSIVGNEMWRLLRGEEVEREESEQKSISHSHVLPPELRTEPGALRILKKLTTKAALRLRRERFWTTHVEIHAQFAGGSSWKAHRRLDESQDTLLLVQTVTDLWSGLPPGPVYSVGVVFGGLVHDTRHRPTLFEDPRRNELNRVLDAMNEKFGKDKIHFGAVHESEGLAPLRIAFTRIPDERESE